MTILLIAGESPLRESLVALLQALPEIGTIHCLDDPAAALTSDPHICPEVVLVDGDLVEGKTYSAASLTKQRWPAAGMILFANDVRQQRDAQSAGVELALLKGHPAPHLVSVIRGMMIIKRGRWP